MDAETGIAGCDQCGEQGLVRLYDGIALCPDCDEVAPGNDYGDRRPSRAIRC